MSEHRDLTTHNLGDPNFLYRNESRANNWIQFRLTGTQSNRDAIGARITLATPLETGEPAVQQIREIAAGSGFFSDFPRIQTFGLGKATTARRVQIRWPSGQIQDLGPCAANQRYDIVEPAP